MHDHMSKCFITGQYNTKGYGTIKCEQKQFMKKIGKLSLINTPKKSFKQLDPALLKSLLM